LHCICTINMRDIACDSLLFRNLRLTK
jgi:hypothetical protein